MMRVGLNQEHVDHSYGALTARPCYRLFAKLCEWFYFANCVDHLLIKIPVNFTIFKHKFLGFYFLKLIQNQIIGSL